MGNEPRILLYERHHSLTNTVSNVWNGLTDGSIFRQLRGHLNNRFLTFQKIHKSSLEAFPKLVNIELTNYCNHKCKFCVTGLDTNTREKGKMNFSTFKLIADQLSPGTLLILAGFGEPFLNPELESFLEYAHSRGLSRDLEILSNFGAISEKRVRKLLDYPFKRLVISLDSMSKETFLAYRGCDDFDNVCDKIKILADELAKRKSISQEIVLQMVINKKNNHERESFIDFAKKMGLIPRIKQLNTHNSKVGEAAINEFEVRELSRYTNKDYSFACEWIWGGMMVLWSGDVTICCQDPIGTEVYGNVKNDSIFDLLNTSRLRCCFRQRYFENPGQIGICRRCDVA